MTRLYIPLFFLSVVLLSSCSRSYQYLDARATDQFIEYNDSIFIESQVEVEAIYAGIAFDLSVFEVDIYNNSNDTLNISRWDILLAVNDEFYGEELLLDPLEKSFLVETFVHDKRQVKKSNRRNTFWNIFTSGITLVSLMNTPGVPRGNTIGYAANSALNIVEDRMYYNALEGSLDERIEYIEDWVLDKATILPGEHYSFDILFDHFLTNSDCTLEINCKDNTFKFPFILEIKRSR